MTTRWDAELSSLRRIAFDTNALIYLLESREPRATYVGRAIGRLENDEAVGFVSTIVEMELLVKPIRERDGATRDKVEAFLRNTHNLAVRSVDRVIARRAADVRAATGLASMDAILVATAMETRCDAVIGNDSIVASRATGIPYIYLDNYIS